MITVKKAAEKKEIECEFCHAVLEYEPSDVHDVWGGLGFTCPECGNDVVVEEMVTDRPIYPKNFFKFGGVDAYVVPDDEIQKWCDEVFDELKNSEDSHGSYSVANGDTIVFGDKYENGEIVVRVAKNYEEFDYFQDI